MRARRTIRTLVSTLVLLPAAVGASAGDPSVTILQPTAGATHSKAAGPIAVSGAVGFEQPAPADTRLFLRYAAEGGTNCGRRYLSTTNGPDPGNSCQSTGAHLTLAGQSFTRDWPADPAEVALPLTLDASRNITGEININSRFLGTAGAPLASPGNWVTLDVVVRLGDTALTQSFDSGLYTGATRKFSLNLDIPAS
ncbi:MAG TPA: hypothetical protein VM638_02430, partial [Actinomycetota bacterium]|nr:hypothetical protein [Actinomycetota bacterium]